MTLTENKVLELSRPGSYLGWLLALALLLILSGCTTSPPVQEMSDARQALAAAREANAPRYAPDAFQQAEQLLERARRELEEGNYHGAREAALDAKREAIRARDDAVSIGHER